MKHFTLFLRKGFTSALALALAMIVLGGGSALADTVIVDGSTIADGWQNGAGNSSNNYTILVDDNCIQSSSSSYSRLRSVSSMTLTNQRIVAQVKRLSGEESYFIMYVGWSANEKVKFGYNSSTAGNGNEIYSDEDYIELISEKITISSAAVLDFRAKNLLIKSIKIVDDGALELSENQMTALQKGSKSESVHVKYTPKKGWNTICLPFQLRSGSYNHLETIFGSDISIFTVSGYSDGTLSFKNAIPNNWTAINANTPVIVYAENPPTCPEEGFELAPNVTMNYPSNGTPSTTVDGVTFQGTYAPKAAGTLTGNYGVTSYGSIAKAGSGASLKGYRAYFTGVPAGSEIKGFVIDGEDATDIGLVQMVEGSDKPVYNMSGQKVQKAQRGIYIINGKKVVIK